MIIIFESILPVFLLVLLGIALKRAPFINLSLWDGLEQFGYYVLFPALMFLTLAKADFASLNTGAVSATAIVAVLVMAAVAFVLWPVFKRSGTTGAAFTSVFQTTTRWNAFMALAIAEKIAGHAGLTIVAVVMAAIIVPLNFLNVGVLLWFSGGTRSFRAFALKIISNPIILGSFFGIAVNVSGLPIYSPILVAVDMVARSALGLSLIIVGAGLRISDALKPHPLAIVACGLKLLVFPLVMVGVGLLFGVSGNALMMLALSAAVPTAMNGYVLAKQMGGDAPLYAAIATIQTVASFVTIPVALFFAGYVAAG